MMQEVYKALLELQDLDEEILQTDTELAAYGPRLEELERPVTTLGREMTEVRDRLAAMRDEVRRLERAAEQKRERLAFYEARMNRVRNAREEAAARTEIDLVRHAVEADEQDALMRIEQVTRTELKLDELERHLAAAREEVEPARDELIAERAAVEDRLARLQDQRHNHAVRLDPEAARLYQRASGGRRRRVLAPMTTDGACGQCFNVLPLQQQFEVREARTLMRCEACGVILYPSE